MEQQEVHSNDWQQFMARHSPTNDACSKRKCVSSYEFMAASIGDVVWLDQSLKSIENERGTGNIVTFNKNVSSVNFVDIARVMSRSSSGTLSVVMHRVVLKLFFVKLPLPTCQLPVPPPRSIQAYTGICRRYFDSLAYC